MDCKSQELWKCIIEVDHNEDHIVAEWMSFMSTSKIQFFWTLSFMAQHMRKLGLPPT